MILGWPQPLLRTIMQDPHSTSQDLSPLAYQESKALTWNGWCWLLGGFGNRFTSNAGEDLFFVVAQLLLRIVVQAIGTRPLETIAVRADVVDLTAFLRWIRILTTGFVGAVDGQLLGDTRHGGGLDVLGGRSSLAGARKDV